MEITVKRRNQELKVIHDFELEEELEKVISIKNLDLPDILHKLDRGDLLGFNDTHFRRSEKND